MTMLFSSAVRAWPLRALCLGLVLLPAILATLPAHAAGQGQRLPAQQPVAAPDIKTWWDMKNSRRPQPFDRVHGRYASERIAPQADMSFAGSGPRSIPAPSAPPAPRPEFPYPNQDPTQQWIPGDWRFVGGTWAWRPGRYATPPTPGLIWARGTWTPAPWGYGWTEGRWINPMEHDPAADRVTDYGTAPGNPLDRQEGPALTAPPVLPGQATAR